MITLPPKLPGASCSLPQDLLRETAENADKESKLAN